MKKLLAILSFLIINSSFLISPPPASAQSLDFQCIGRTVAEYMNAVVTGATNAGIRDRIKLLSPAFNMTSYTFEPIASAMVTFRANFAGLDGVAGNAYNIDGPHRPVTSWVDEKLAILDGLGVPTSLKVYLTEIGSDPSTPPNVPGDLLSPGFLWLKDEIATGIRPHPRIAAATLFDSMLRDGNDPASTAYNSDINYKYNWMLDSQIANVCGNAPCTVIGQNFASSFPGPADSAYSRASSLGMNYLVGIVDSGSANSVREVYNAFPGTLILRIGGGGLDNGGFADPATYVNFLLQLAAFVDPARPIYVIAGPNEPETDQWVSAGKCSPTTQVVVDGPEIPALTIPCPDNRDNYHYLRPYPANPTCDPLIPRSIPEAPAEPNKKFNTLSCGNALSVTQLQDFDGYGDNGQYEQLVVPGPEGGTYIHTWCDTRPGAANYIDVFSGGTITCWRTVSVEFAINLNRANVGILGNTQNDFSRATDPDSDRIKVNEYINWYLTGATAPDTAGSIDRAGSFSGPLYKLLPQDFAGIITSTINSPPTVGSEIHPNKYFNNPTTLDPIASYEDVAGEFVPYADPNNQPPNIIPAGYCLNPNTTPSTIGCTAPLQVLPISATLFAP